MCYRKKVSGTIGNDSCIQQRSLRVFLFLFTFFLTGSENGLVDIQLQIQQEDFVLLERRRAPNVKWWKREQERHSKALHRADSALFCLACTWACSTFNRHLPRGQ